MYTLTSLNIAILSINGEKFYYLLSLMLKLSHAEFPINEIYSRVKVINRVRVEKTCQSNHIYVPRWS